MKLKTIAKARVPVVEAGSYLAVCVGVLFVGEQYLPPFGERKNGRYEHQLMLIWEIPSERDANNAPVQLSRCINISFSAKSALTAIMSGWNSRSYSKEELQELEVYDQLGKSCMLTVATSESGYANVTAVSAIPKGIQPPTTTTDYIRYSVDEWDQAKFEALPEWAQSKIKASTQYQQLYAPEVAVDFPDAGQAEAGSQTPPAATPSGGALREAVQTPTAATPSGGADRLVSQTPPAPLRGAPPSGRGALEQDREGAAWDVPFTLRDSSPQARGGNPI